jgi:hypothetical protein
MVIPAADEPEPGSLVGEDDGSVGPVVSAVVGPPVGW